MTKEEVEDIIRDSGYGVLATTDQNQPKVRPMVPYLTDDKRLLIALLGRSRSIKEVQANPLVEICFVDRKMWYCRISGKATITDNADDKQTLWNNIPMLKQYFGGIEDSNFNLMVVEINQVEAMSPHQKEPEFIDFT